MKALEQYISLYKENKGLIDSHSAPVLNALRSEALPILEGKELPKVDSDNYENCDLESMLSPNYGLNLSNIAMNVDVKATFQCDLPRISSSIFMMINDRYAETTQSRSDLPEGVEVGSLRKAAEREPEFIKQYYGELADLSNPIVALNTLFAQDGFYIRIKKGVVLEKPLQLVNILKSEFPLMAVRRVLIIIEENAEARLLVCDHTQNADQSLCSIETTEIYVGKNARFDYYNLEESTELSTRMSTLWLRQDESSRVGIDGLTLFNGTTRNEYYCSFNGEAAQLDLFGMGIEDASRKVSSYSRVNHNYPRCHSNQLFKYTLADRSRAAFSGLVYVAEGAVKTEAYQSNRNIVESKESRMQSKPQLEIYNDDVTCSHGSATGQLDANQMFYMRARGLSEATARLLLKQAFMADVIDRISLPVLRDRLHMLVERRFAGVQSACFSCLH